MSFDASGRDIFVPPTHIEYCALRIERTIRFVSRKLLDMHEALGGQTLEEAGLDVDTPLPRAATQMIRGWAHSKDGILGYAAQWGMLEAEQVLVHNIRVYINGELVHEENQEL